MQDFLNAVQRGIRRDGARLYPAMPYPSYTYMTDADALAIKAYLVQPAAGARRPIGRTRWRFPFNQRWAMIFWSVLFNENTRFEPNTAQSPEWNRGAYLAEALAHCGECHTPRNLAFALDNRKKFAGAVTAGWRAFNISSDKAPASARWSDEELAAYLSTGHASGRGTAAGPMGEAVDQSFSQLAPEDIQRRGRLSAQRAGGRLARICRRRSRRRRRPRPSKAAAPRTFAGKKVFEGACVSCHGWTGVSPISPFATIAGARAVNDPQRDQCRPDRDLRHEAA